MQSMIEASVLLSQDTFITFKGGIPWLVFCEPFNIGALYIIGV